MRPLLNGWSYLNPRRTAPNRGQCREDPWVIDILLNIVRKSHSHGNHQQMSDDSDSPTASKRPSSLRTFRGSSPAPHPYKTADNQRFRRPPRGGLSLPV